MKTRKKFGANEALMRPENCLAGMAISTGTMMILLGMKLVFKLREDSGCIGRSAVSWAEALERAKNNPPVK